MSRRSNRYWRRVEKRLRHKQERSDEIGDIDDVFTFDKMFKYGMDCCKGVRWKASVQNFELHLFSGTARRLHDIKCGKYKWRPFTHFILAERGKIRPIDAPHIRDRQIHKTLTKEVLLPLYRPLMIWNNGASLERKGLAFSQKELVEDLRRHYRKYGMRGHVIITDCSKFFPSADHEYIFNLHKKIISSPKLRELADSVIKSTKWEQGLPLGVEPSQVEMIHYPSMLDTYMQCQLGLGGSGHYMDDYYMLIPPHMNPKEVLKAFREKALENRIILSERKTRIVKFGKPFRFCKAKYTVVDTGKVIVNGSRETAKRFRRKMKAFSYKVKHKLMTYVDIWASVQSAISYYEHANDYGRILSLKKYFFSIFGFCCDQYDLFREMDNPNSWRANLVKRGDLIRLSY